VGLCATTVVWLESALAHRSTPMKKFQNLSWCLSTEKLPPIPKQSNLLNLGAFAPEGQVICGFLGNLFSTR
jgi:hypothetical protein